MCDGEIKFIHSAELFQSTIAYPIDIFATTAHDVRASRALGKHTIISLIPSDIA